MHLRTDPDYKYREMAGMHYLIPCAEAAARSEAPIQLTETAAWIWTQMEKGIGLDEIAACMTEEFDVDNETARAAVKGFGSLLIKQGMGTAAED